MNIIERLINRWRSSPRPRAAAPRQGPPDNGILISLRYIEDASYGEYADIRHKAVRLAQILTKKQQMPLLADGSQLEYAVETDRISIRNVSGPRDKFPSGIYHQCTHIDLCLDGKIAFSITDEDELHELMIRPNGRPSYCNSRFGQGTFPNSSINAFLESALEAA